jgi:hypothetical protein
MAMAGRSSRSKGLVLLLVVVVLGGAALLYVRSRGDGSPSASELAETQTSCSRLLTFSSLLSDPGLFPPTPTATVRPESVASVVTKMGRDLDLVVDSSPARVRGDVRALVSALRSQPGDPAAIRSPAFSEARQRLATFLSDPANGCQLGSESGSG